MDPLSMLTILFCRACVGRNLAFIELQIIIASIIRRYDIVLEKEGQKVSVRVNLSSYPG